MSRTLLFRTFATLALGWAAALAWRHFNLPLPWVIGPLLATAAASMAGAPTQSFTPLRNGAQWIIGAALGLYFTPQVLALVVRLWWAVALALVWALVVGWAFGFWLDRVLVRQMPDDPMQRRATSYFAGAIGGASEMTLLAERAGGRTDLVAAAHSLRILVVTIGIPFAFQFGGLHGLDPSLPGPRTVVPAGLAVLGIVTLAGSWFLSRTSWANPWFIGAFIVSMAITLGSIELSAMPALLSNAAQVVIGVSLGVRFRAEFVHSAPRWLVAVTVGTVGMVFLCAGFAWLLGQAMGLHPATLVLGTAPGGIVEMAITAKVLALGVPVVTAFQVCRLAAVLILVEPLYRRLGLVR